MRNLGMPGASLALRRRSAFTPGYGELGGQQDGAACGADEVSMADLTSSRRRVENEPQCGRRDQLTRLGRRAVAGSPAPSNRPNASADPHLLEQRPEERTLAHVAGASG